MMVEIPSRHRDNPPAQKPTSKASTSTAQPAPPCSPPAIERAKQDRALVPADVLALLDKARKLCHQLPLSVPEWDPNERGTTSLWDANRPEDIPRAFAGGGEDCDEDWENLDPILNHVLQMDVPLDTVMKGIRRGPCGTLGIIEGLAFFVEKRGLDPVYFGTKLQRLVEALELRIR